MPGRTDRRVMAAALAVLLTALSVSVPLLDRGGPDGAWVVHAEHPLSAHLNGHDHTICTQHSASPWLALNVRAAGPMPVEGVAPETGSALRLDTSSHHHPRRSRAPPIV